MGTSGEKQQEILNEITNGHKGVPIDIINKVNKSICKIIITKSDKKTEYGTGFFLKASDSLEYFITTVFHGIIASPFLTKNGRGCNNYVYLKS